MGHELRIDITVEIFHVFHGSHHRRSLQGPQTLTRLLTCARMCYLTLFGAKLWNYYFVFKF